MLLSLLVFTEGLLTMRPPSARVESDRLRQPHISFQSNSSQVCEVMDRGIDHAFPQFSVPHTTLRSAEVRPSDVLLLSADENFHTLLTYDPAVVQRPFLVLVRKLHLIAQ